MTGSAGPPRPGLRWARREERAFAHPTSDSKPILLCRPDRDRRDKPGDDETPATRAVVHWVFAQAAVSGLFAALRTRHDAERSVGKAAAVLAAPQ